MYHKYNINRKYLETKTMKPKFTKSSMTTVNYILKEDYENCVNYENWRQLDKDVWVK